MLFVLASKDTVIFISKIDDLKLYTIEKFTH